MTLDRRDFLKTSLTLSAGAALSVPTADALGESALADVAAKDREFYELRCYHRKADTRLKADADPTPLDAYLERALFPALAARHITNVGAFTEVDINRAAATMTPKAGSPLWLLIPHASFESFVRVSGEINDDRAVQAAGREYLELPKSRPAFERIDTWLLRAFAGMPRMEVPTFSRAKSSSRVFEMRDYESYSEAKALNKMAMFNETEITVMRDLGMSPMFFGQALAGRDLPHLRYFTGGVDLTAHLSAWAKFGADPRWVAIKDLPRFAENVSKNTSRFLVPTSYSAI